jgi:hypothetical protein
MIKWKMNIRVSPNLEMDAYHYLKCYQGIVTKCYLSRLEFEHEIGYADNIFNSVLLWEEVENETRIISNYERS